MRINFCSWLEAKTNCSTEEITHPESIKTISDLALNLAERHETAASLFRMPQALWYVVNQQYVDPNFEITDSDTIDIYPPVTGG